MLMSLGSIYINYNIDKRREGKKRRKAWCLICTLPPSNSKKFNLKTNLHLVFRL